MGWEVAQNKTHDGMFIRYAFFCNTGDEAFGHVFYLNDCDDIGTFYDAWSEVNEGIDPRTIDSEALWECILNMKEYFGEDISDYRESPIIGVDE
jgi:hypothetical protein